MADYRRANTRRNYRYRSYNSGRERALQHIREAEELSQQLGGTDRDVKEYFFSLTRPQLQTVLEAYGETFGRDKREYAEKAFHEWKSGTKKMSGLVADRLFNLLPPLMPFEKKYDLVANLWREMGPSSHKVLKIGPNTDIETIVERTRVHVMETVQRYTIPQGLQQRFQWLTMGDVGVQQQLMNHLLEMEKRQSVELTRLQIPSMLDHIHNHADYTHRLAQLVRLVEQFMRADKITITPALFAQDDLKRRLIMTLNMTKVVQHIWEAIRFENTQKLEPVFDRDRPIRSTGDMGTWYTGKPCEPAARSHINFCVYDSTWEASEAFELDHNPAVEAWVKNDHLGFEVLYIHRGVVRKYRPDFLIRLQSGSYLVLETKGKDTGQDQTKRRFLDEWVKAVNEHGGFGAWSWDVSRDPGDIKDVLALMYTATNPARFERL